MTDKQIIDGIDVSGCEFYNKDDKTCREANGKYNMDICDFDKCENLNCYYKQLVQTEQKLDKIKKVCNKFVPDHYKILLIINDGTVEE